MEKLLDGIVRLLEAGGDAVLISVYAREGSAPRGVGASMLLPRGGAQMGTIGGGSVEFEAAAFAGEMLESGEASAMREYRLYQNEAADLGMVCGGTVRVLFEHLTPTPQRLKLYRGLAAARDASRRAALVRVIADGRIVSEGYYDGETLHGVQCELENGAGGNAYVSADGSVLVEPVTAGRRVWVYGGGHVSQKLVPLLRFVSFSCVVCEDRAAFAEPSIFPDAEAVRLGDFSDIRTFEPVQADDFAVVMTRGHQADYAILRQLLKTDAVYIGCIGSRAKIAITRQRLLDDGFSETDFARIHTPIGLPIRAETPEEIAVSVAAELILCRAQQNELRKGAQKSTAE